MRYISSLASLEYLVMQGSWIKRGLLFLYGSISPTYHLSLMMPLPQQRTEELVVMRFQCGVLKLKKTTPTEKLFGDEEAVRPSIHLDIFFSFLFVYKKNVQCKDDFRICTKLCFLELS